MNDSESFDLSTAELSVLNEFSTYLMRPGQMLCFSGPVRDGMRAALTSLIDKDMLTEEAFDGGYSLTRLGFRAMRKTCR